jgi:1,3-beta-glucan synthase
LWAFIGIDAYTLLYDLNFGRAGYIASGRGFATARNPFYQLYTAFAEPSIYLGLRLFLILTSVTHIMGFSHLAFFWFMVIPLMVAPFLFNPHMVRISSI